VIPELDDVRLSRFVIDNGQLVLLILFCPIPADLDGRCDAAEIQKHRFATGIWPLRD